MSARVRVRHDADAHLVAVKVGLDRTQDARLVREAAMLAAVRQPGVVGLVRLADGPDGLELVTRWVGTRSLADVTPLPPREAAAVVGALAAIVADLHRRGIVHCGIDSRHVLLDRQGRPVLCSFGLACFAPATSGRADGPHDHPRCSDDVAALGELLLAAIGKPPEPELVPTRRLARRSSDHLHRSLLTIADHARAHDAASRPGAAALAASLAELVPLATFPTGAEPHDPSPDVLTAPPGAGIADLELERLRATAAAPPPRRRRLWPFSVASAVLAVGIVGLGSRMFSSSSSSGTDSVSIIPIRQVPPREPSTTSTTADREPRPTSSGSPPQVEIENRRFSVGTPGDVVVVAPWRCDGTPRALVLRPNTAELFLFDEEATPGHDEVARSFATVPGATELTPVEPEDPCPLPAVLHADGRITYVALPPSA